MNAEKQRYIRILLIEDEPEQAALISAMFRDDADAPVGEASGTAYTLKIAHNLSIGMRLLAKGEIDVVLLDLLLPDSKGLVTYETVCAAALDVPVVILTSCAEEENAAKALTGGAQDYISKGDMSKGVLRRAVQYAIERNKLQIKIRALSLKDDLTGLHNRRGFHTLAAQQVKMERRMKRGLFLIFADIDKMKWINDTFGHREGDRALTEFSRLLKSNFRESDIIARIGGDEFAVLAMDTNAMGPKRLVERLHRKIKARTARGDLGYVLSASVGGVRCEPGKPLPVDEMLRRADEAMYSRKIHAKKRRTGAGRAGARAPKGGRHAGKGHAGSPDRG